MLNNFSEEMTSVLTHGNRGLGAWIVFNAFEDLREVQCGFMEHRGAVVKEVLKNKKK